MMATLATITQILSAMLVLSQLPGWVPELTEASHGYNALDHVRAGHHKNKTRHDRSLILPVLLEPGFCLINQVRFGAVGS
jgi:hypothetical protein